MTAVSVNVHHPILERITRLDNTDGIMAVRIGGNVALLLDDGELRQLIADLTEHHRALLTAEYLDATEGGPNAVAEMSVR